MSDVPEPQVLCRRLVDLASPEDVVRFKHDAPPLSVGVWTVLERAAERGDRAYAAKAVAILFQFAASQNLLVFPIAPDQAQEVFAEMERSIASEDLSRFGAKTSDRIADLTVAQLPADDGLSRLVARHGERVVYDEVHDFVELMDLLPRIMAGDPEVVGGVPLIFDGENYHVKDPPCSCGSGRPYEGCCRKEVLN